MKTKTSANENDSDVNDYYCFNLNWKELDIEAIITISTNVKIPTLKNRNIVVPQQTIIQALLFRLRWSQMRSVFQN